MRWKNQEEAPEYVEGKMDYTKGELGLMADEFLREDSRREICRKCYDGSDEVLYGEETDKIEQRPLKDKDDSPVLDDDGNQMYGDFPEYRCDNEHAWHLGEGKARGIDGENPVLFEEHIHNRRKREIYTSGGTPDPSIESGLYHRTHPQGRKVNSPEQRKKHGASFTGSWSFGLVPGGCQKHRDQLSSAILGSIMNQDPVKHRENVSRWLNDPAHPERLEAKRERDRQHYRKNRERLLAYQNEYYAANKAKVADRNRRYREEIYHIAFEAKQAPCERCGHSYPAQAMEFHHIDPTTKKGEICNMSTPNLARKELAKCIVVCGTCHNLIEAGL